MAKPVEHNHTGAEIDDLKITIQLKTPWGQENYEFPARQLSALRTYLKILSCMNAGNVAVTPEGGTKCRRS